MLYRKEKFFCTNSHKNATLLTEIGNGVNLYL